MKKKLNNRNYLNYVVGLVVLLVGFGAGYITNGLLQTKPASAQEIEQAKNEIVDLYKDKAVDACWKVNDGPLLAAEKYELTYRNIQINQHANRAIITDCAENSTLLAKDNLGQWIATNVNLTNFGRINPTWQKACQIEDITVADDTVRSENSSVDEMNLAECKQLHK